MLTKEELPAYPVATLVRMIGNKWKILILRNLLTKPNRFSELRKTIPGISNKVLTENLRSMEEDELILRIVFPEVPPHIEYKLSKTGESLRPIITAMEAWGLEYQNLVK